MRTKQQETAGQVEASKHYARTEAGAWSTKKQADVLGSPSATSMGMKGTDEFDEELFHADCDGNWPGMG